MCAFSVARIDAERAWTMLRDPRWCVRSRTAIAHDVYSASQFVLRSASSRLAQELARAGLSPERHARKGPASHPTEWLQQTYSVLQLTLNERRTAPEGRLWLPESTPRIAEDREALAMLVIDESVADRPDLQGAYFVGS